MSLTKVPFSWAQCVQSYCVWLWSSTFIFVLTLLARIAFGSAKEATHPLLALTLQSWRGSWYWLSSQTRIGCARERKREREPGQDSALSLTSCTLSLRRGWRGSSLRPWQTLDRKLSSAFLWLSLDICLALPSGMCGSCLLQVPSPCELGPVHGPRLNELSQL